MAELQKRELVTGETIYFSLVEKQSERGFSLNKRIFLMLENQFICYLSSPKTDFPLTLDHLEKLAKMVVPLNQISKISYLPKHNSFEIWFWLQQQGKPKQKSWVLKMGTENLFQCWQQVFDEYSNRSRKGTLEQVNLVENLNTKGDNQIDPVIRNSGINNRNKVVTKSNRQALEQEMNNSAHLLDPNESYFAHIHLVSPSPSKGNQQSNMASLKDKTRNIELSKIKGRNSYFSSFGGQAGSRTSFKNYYRPYFEDLLKIGNEFLRQSQLDELDRAYGQFVEYAQQQVVLIVDSKLKQIIQKEKQRLGYESSADVSISVSYGELEDVVVEFGLIELQEVGGNAFVCDDSLNRAVLNNFGKLDYLYKIISRDPQLRKSFFIPMGCVVYYKGFECLVRCKVDPQTDEEYLLFAQNSSVSSRELFQKLSQLSRVSFEMFDDQRNIEFVARNQKQDKFAIVSAKRVLPNLEDGLPVRKETFTAVFNTVNGEMYSYSKLKQREESHKLKLSNRLIFKIKELSDLMNKLQIYPITPCEFSSIFHSFGLNSRHMAKVYSNLTHAYVRRIIKTDAALRAFKLIFRKKIQQTVASNESGRVLQIGRELINMLLGMGQNSSDMWKVVSLHAQKHFSLSVEVGQMIKGYLFLGLGYHLAAELVPAYTIIDSIFKVNNFIQAVKFRAESRCSSVLPVFLQDIQEDYAIAMSSSLFKTIMKTFHLKEKPFPVFIQRNKEVHLKLMHLCAFYIKPKDEGSAHLQLYGINVSNQVANTISLDFFSLQRKLTEVRWQIKLGAAREHILLLLGKVKQSLQNYYSVYHPFLSDIYELQSLYFLQLGEYETAVAVGRQSLSNMIQCCANNNQHIKISNNYYQIAEYLVQSGQIEEGLTNYRKARHILEVNNYQKLPEYAHLLCRIGALLLKQNRDHDSHQNFLHALNIYQQHDPLSHWDAVVDLFEMLGRSQPKPSPNRKTPEQDLHLAQICLTQLERALAVELQFELCSDQQFVRIMKIVIEFYFGRLRREDVVVFRDYLIELCDSIVLGVDKDLSLREAVLFFKSMVMEGSFATTIQNYVSHTGEVMSRRSTEQRVVRLIPRLQSGFIEGYDRFMRYMVELVGEPFFLNIIK